MMLCVAIISALAAWPAAAEDVASLVPLTGSRAVRQLDGASRAQGSLRGTQLAELGRRDGQDLLSAPGTLPQVSGSGATEVDLSEAVVLQGYGQGGYQQGIQAGGYGQGHYGQSNGQFSLLLSVLIPIVVLVCACCCVIQLARCCCGEVCGGNMDPMLGAGLGAVAGYEMGQYMDGGYGGYGGYGQQPMY